MSSSKSSVTCYQESYEIRFPWVKPARSSTDAFCTWCRKIIHVGSMGRSALVSHATGKKHRALAEARHSSLLISHFTAVPGAPKEKIQQSEESERDPVDLTSPPSQQSLSCSAQAVQTPLLDSKRGPCSLAGSSNGKLQRFLLNEQVTRAEVRWCLQAAVSHHSYRSAAEDAKAFPAMFPDSDIAKKVELGRTKVAYTIVYGIAPHFRRLLQKQLDSCKFVVVGFDESLNKVSKTQQMDIIVRFWNEDKQETVSRYFDSAFLTSSTASELKKALTLALGELNCKKIIQVSMDGPAVNFRMLDDLKAEMKREREGEMLLVDIGSCGLHVMHGAFKAACKELGWGIVEFLTSLFHLFSESPARRGHFTRHTGSSLFPLKWSTVRWIENTEPAKRAETMLPNLKKWVNIVVSEKSYNSLNKNHFNFSVVCKSLEDKLLPAKLGFFITLASLVEPFLTSFQTDAPMAPFLYRELQFLMVQVMGRFLKKTVMAKTMSLFKVDLKDNGNFLSANEIEVGFHTLGALAAVKGKVKDLDILHFKNDCRNAYIALVDKLLERSPLIYKFTRGLSCFDPFIIADDVSEAERRLNKCLTYVSIDRKIVPPSTADRIKEEYKRFCGISANMNIMRSYDRRSKRLDHLWMELTGQQLYPHLHSFLRIILILSHGNAALERGFSINKECLLDNQSEKSLVARRLIHDHVNFVGGVNSVELDKSVIHAARNASSMYKDSLKRQREEEQEKDNAARKKREESRILHELEARKQDILREAAAKAAVIDEKIMACRR